MNNFVFGEAMENATNRIALRLVVADKKTRKLQIGLQAKRNTETDGSQLIELFHKEVLYDKHFRLINDMRFYDNVATPLAIKALVLLF